MRTLAVISLVLSPLAAFVTVPAGRTAMPRRAMLRMDEEAEAEPPPVTPPPRAAAAAPGLSPCTIKVIGVGGGGGNTLNRMVEEGPGVERSTFLEYVACNTDVQVKAARGARGGGLCGSRRERPGGRAHTHAPISPFPAPVPTAHPLTPRPACP